MKKIVKPIRSSNKKLQILISSPSDKNNNNNNKL